MSRVIRTARVGGQAVILGKDESNLYLTGTAVEDIATVDFSAVIESRLEQVRAGLTTEWEGRLRDEHETMKAAANKHQAEAEQAHRAQVDEVHQQRYEEGHRDGVQSKEDEVREALARMAALHESLAKLRRQVMIESEALVVDLSVSIAHRVTGVRAELEPTTVARVIRSALEHLSADSNLVIKVHEEDLQMARKFSAKWVEKVATGSILRVEVSDHIERGGCMIEGKEESVDARLEEQFEVLRNALRGKISEQGEDSAADETVTDTAAVADDEPAVIVDSLDIQDDADADTNADPDTPEDEPK